MNVEEEAAVIRRSIVASVVATLLVGCAASVQKPSTNAAPVRVPAGSASRIVLSMSGPARSTQSKDWEAFKGEWRAALMRETAAAGIAFAPQEGGLRPTGERGTLLDVYIDDYRYLSSGTRYGLGIFAGNAFIVAKVRFLDLNTGKVFGTQEYNTSSTAWQGIFSAMTDKQVEAIAKEIVREVQAR